MGIKEPKAEVLSNFFPTSLTIFGSGLACNCLDLFNFFFLLLSGVPLLTSTNLDCPILVIFQKAKNVQKQHAANM